MSIADKLTTIAENMNEVYQKGVDVGETALRYRSNGNFSYFWSNATFPPNTDFILHHQKITSMSRALQYVPNIRSITLISDDTSDIISLAWAFPQTNATYVDLTRCSRRITECDYCFSEMTELKSIYGALDLTECTTTNNAFANTKTLEDIEFVPNTVPLALNFRQSTKLSKASITSIINGLSPETSGLTVTLSKEAVDNAFEDAEWSELEATKPNWTISLV